MTAADTLAGLLRRILEEPGDDALRLVYADALEESGRPARAELIRVQVRLASMPEPAESTRPVLMGWRVRDGHPSGDQARAAAPYWALKQREQGLTLLLGSGTGTDPPPPASAAYDHCDWRWGFAPRRGFLESVALSTAKFLTHAAGLFSAQPVTAVRLRDKRPSENRWRDGHWAWFDESVPVGSGPYAPAPDVTRAAWLPAGLMLLVEAEDKASGGRKCKWFNSDEAAHAALSRACVAYGRRAAGLPALPPSRAPSPAPGSG